MSETLRTALSAAVIRILRPLVRTVLRSGLSYKAFNDLIKWIYVDVAMKEFRITGRKNSKSRVAVLTGLTRREVDRLVRLPEPKEGTPERYNRAARVLSGWAEDPQFRGPDGKPADLPMEGEGSFGEVVRLYSGNQPVRAVLDELVRVGSVLRLDEERVRLLKAYYEPVTGKQEEEKINIFGIASGDLLETIAHNINRHDDELEPSFYQQEVYERVTPEKVSLFRELLRRHCDRFADDTDRFLYRELGETTNKEPRAGDRRVGVGIYYFESDWEGG
jgi:hypothetical protein